MQDFEKLGAFYLGCEYDLAAKQVEQDHIVLYDAKDLTTHAVCVGMTGSGKTGLCLTLLEEAAIDGIPAIAIDPKGDLGNLALAFPQLTPDDFSPWIEEADATRKGLTAEEYAQKTANTWREGLAAWGQDPARIEKYRSAVDLAIYTPGSYSGLPLTVLRSFSAPPPALAADTDALRERVVATASGLLALMGIDADPIRSREHILLSQILDKAWREGRSLDLPTVIRELQQPSFDKIGYIDLETFFPAKERFALSMTLNSLVASPSFAAWMEGDPLDIGKLLYTAEGKPRLSIISIAHLSEAERMFFVTILLNEVLAWTRSQPGTSSLRALLYMDEVYGYFPPTANPPSKTPMLTLLKQARAYGLGVVLATQNPVDLDYKGLSNAGTWFLGRLQTERDKARVLEGLEGASASAGAHFDKQKMEQTLAGLGNRVFLMNNVHDDHPVVFQTRWCLSYLRGPLTRGQIQTLMEPKKKLLQAARASAAPGTVAGSAGPLMPSASPAQRPMIPPAAGESFIPRLGSIGSGGKLVYRPALLGQGRVHFVDAKQDIDLWQDVVLLAPVGAEIEDDLWEEAEVLRDGPPNGDKDPEAGAEFVTLPPELTRAKSYASWKKSLQGYLYRSQSLDLVYCDDLKEISKAGESEGEFRARLGHKAREKRDLDVEKLKQKYAPKLRTIEDQMRRAEEKVAREESQYRQSMLQSAISVGQTVLGALMGRKLGSKTNMTSTASTMRTANKTLREREDVARAEDSVEAVQRRWDDLNAEFDEETAKIEAAGGVDQLRFEPYPVRPRKSDISVSQVSLAWVPWRVDASGLSDPVWR
ncbi:MAG: ATP-binding protein [Pirellulales bacterium]